MKKMFFSRLAVLVIVAGMVLSGCGGGGSSSGSSSPAPASPSGTVEGNAK
jgi:ABC-type glycerol-3-phosphate transport system substrate-binding protein